jgi:endonuclease/exonuclease/phosphatase family metal-dependent hydrolase
MHNLKQLFILVSLATIGLSIKSQNPGSLSFGSGSTLEIVTWNIENFPKEGQVTIENVKGIVSAMDADILALQEIDEPGMFNQMLLNFEGYSGYVVPGGYANLAFIYKSSNVQINRIYEIYTSSEYWSPFPRPPLVLDFDFNNLNFIVINNHLKCCGDGILDTGDLNDEETRRYRANNLLRQYVNAYFPDKMVFIVGDMNDELTDGAEDNVFQQILADTENYLFTDLEIANGNSTNWSYPSWPSHLDHIAITNELFPAFENEGSEIRVIKAEHFFSGGWGEYRNKVSDHRPLGIKLSLPADLGIVNQGLAGKPLYCFPNPFSEKTTISIPYSNKAAIINIFNNQGKKVYSETIRANQISMTWDTDNAPDGIYFARIIAEGVETATVKLVLVR